MHCWIATLYIVVEQVLPILLRHRVFIEELTKIVSSKCQKFMLRCITMELTSILAMSKPSFLLPRVVTWSPFTHLFDNCLVDLFAEQWIRVREFTIVFLCSGTVRYAPRTEFTIVRHGVETGCINKLTFFSTALADVHLPDYCSSGYWIRVVLEIWESISLYILFQPVKNHNLPFYCMPSDEAC